MFENCSFNCRRKKYTPKPSETKSYYTRNELSPMLDLNWHPGFGQCYAATRCGPRWNSVGDVNQRNPLDLQSAKSTPVEYDMLQAFRRLLIP